MAACAWCGKLAVTTVTVADEIIEAKGGVKRLKHAAVTAPACAEHREVTERGAPPPTAATTQARPRADHRLRLPRPRMSV